MSDHQDSVDTALIERRRRLLGASYRLFYRQPFHPVRGEGVWLFDRHGTPHLDAYNNVACVGHCHPRVVEAIATQAATLNTHTRYLHETILDCAQRLIDSLPPPLEQMVFTCSGSEANDLAVRMARAFTGGDGLIVTELAYHGVTQSIAEASPSLGSKVRLGQAVRTVPAPVDLGDGAAAMGTRFAAGVQAAIDDLAAHGIRPAALLLDSVFSSDGIITGPRGFLGPAVDAIRRAGGLYIADEVQAGLGRTGVMWGFPRHDVSADLVTLGKPLGNGHPVAGVVGRRDVMDHFGETSRYFNTFGGNPVACAAALAVQSVIAEEGLVEHAATVGGKLHVALNQLADAHPRLGEVRSAGLLAGVEVLDPAGSPDAAFAQALVDALRERHILISATGPHGNVLKIRPPLVFGPEHVESLGGALAASLAALAD
ncbi:aspartate aminotransferase family protein [Salinicola avicenniae]|uniref:aspartate aminotransferase family protein n=1 Tax=Salinicola avicenniae TaxID=2916836 RepID=UPI0020730C6E|nr:MULTISPECIES: aspartate aminotransferase family protein [unclassified Salinicola]